MINNLSQSIKATSGNAKPYKVPSNLSLLIALIATLLAGLLALSLALGIYIVAIFLLVMVVGLVLVAYPKLGLWVTIVGALVGSGLIDLYAPSLKPLVWGLALLATGLACVVLMQSIFKNVSSPATKNTALKFGEAKYLVLWLLAFFLMAIVSSVINWHGFKAVLLGLKGYFQIWGLLIAIYFLINTETQANRLISFFLLLGFIQIPFLLHQFFVLVPQRTSELYAAHGIVAGDIVAGTFGGSMTGGGRSPTLALLCAFCITLALAKWRSGYMSTRYLIVALLFFVFPMFISQVTLFLVLLPIAMLMLFKDRILVNPLKAIAGGLVMVLLISAIFFGYSLLPSARSQKQQSLDKVISNSLEYNLGKRGYGNSKLNRTTVYTFWIEQQARISKIVPMLIGNGPAATSGGAVVKDKQSLGSDRYKGFGIGLTGLSSLLWEVGLLGVLVTAGVFVSAYQLSRRLAQQWSGTKNWASFKAIQIMTVLFGVSLLHINYFVFDLSYQTIFIMLLSYLLVMSRIQPISKQHQPILQTNPS
ncbi:MAG: hypothetical protein ACXW1T_05015 [Methylophilus sp.]